ncbi:hypothetical protein [Crassaminicella thermophila]|uniref:hypothetical protein n=1 Tax=Crassaminicella thermophila TaxID=2599308 RepID=UPI00143D61D7|nr:hypothetical protein [Crassaminicella thermophila]
MKVKALIDCIGIGYNLKAGETAELEKEIAEKLIRFGYAEEIKSSKKTPKK